MYYKGYIFFFWLLNYYKECLNSIQRTHHITSEAQPIFNKILSFNLLCCTLFIYYNSHNLACIFFFYLPYKITRVKKKKKKSDSLRTKIKWNTKGVSRDFYSTYIYDQGE